MAKAVAFGEALKPSFKVYGKQIVKNAQALSEVLIDGGLRVISGGTDNHLLLVDLTPLGVVGKQAEKWLEDVNISVNKNTIPYDKRSPFDPSGIRLGTPSITSRGMKAKDMKVVGDLIIRTVKSNGDKKDIAKIRKEVIKFAKKFPVPGITK